MPSGPKIHSEALKCVPRGIGGVPAPGLRSPLGCAPAVRDSSESFNLGMMLRDPGSPQVPLAASSNAPASLCDWFLKGKAGPAAQSPPTPLSISACAVSAHRPVYLS